MSQEALVTAFVAKMLHEAERDPKIYILQNEADRLARAAIAALSPSVEGTIVQLANRVEGWELDQTLVVTVEQVRRWAMQAGRQWIAALKARPDNG